MAGHDNIDDTSQARSDTGRASINTSRDTTQSNNATISIVSEISKINAKDWDACANPVSEVLNPFVSHTFLSSLEDSGCVNVETGWIPRHLVLRDHQDLIVGVMPCYIKTHSRGEYVFDHAWAQALENAGGNYYPKLQCAIPFTPVPGPRILIKPGPLYETYEQMLIAGAIELTKQMELSSLHITFMEEAQNTRLCKMGLLKRTDQQFHWYNHNYLTFEDFLETLSSRKRKNIRKERKNIVHKGIEIEHLQGEAITKKHWDEFYEFYLDTADRKWGTPYLNRQFFKHLSESMSKNCLLIVAKRAGRNIAGALNIIGGNCLYGRYWGQREHHDGLHFEVCYYQAINYAIESGLARVEAGAQGDHKLARGYIPTTTYSVHWIADQGLHRAVERYLQGERLQINHVQRLLSNMTPYKKTTPQNEDH